MKASVFLALETQPLSLFHSFTNPFVNQVLPIPLLALNIYPTESSLKSYSLVHPDLLRGVEETRNPSVSSPPHHAACQPRPSIRKSSSILISPNLASSENLLTSLLLLSAPSFTPSQWLMRSVFLLLASSLSPSLCPHTS